MASGLTLAAGAAPSAQADEGPARPASFFETAAQGPSGWQAGVVVPWVLLEEGAWVAPLGAGRWPLQAMATLGLVFSAG